MRILLVGAGGAVGTAVHSVLSGRHEVVGVSRTTKPSLDASDETSISSAFAELGSFDAIVSAIGVAPLKPYEELEEVDYLEAFRRKVLSQINLVRLGVPHLSDRGSIAITAGILSTEPIPLGTAASMANGALEAFVMAASPEMPRGIRLNAVSPTVLSTSPAFSDIFAGFSQVASEHVGRAFLRCLEGNITGRVLRLDS